MTKAKRCSFCHEELYIEDRYVTSPLAGDIINGYHNVRNITVCQACILSFVKTTVKTSKISTYRDISCQFCGQKRSGAILSGEGLAKLCTDCAVTFFSFFERYTNDNFCLLLCPRVFISYSHESDEHKAWVIDFVAWLRSRNISVLSDFDYVRGRYRTATTDEIMMFIQLMNSCHAFIPIFTPTYLYSLGLGRRPEFPPEKPDPQWVFDEFQLSLKLGSDKRIETIAVLRDGEFNDLPRPFDATNTLDLRTTQDLNDKLNGLAAHLIFQRACKVVPYLDEYITNFFR